MIEEASEYFGEGWLVFSMLAFELFLIGCFHWIMHIFQIVGFNYRYAVGWIC